MLAFPIPEALGAHGSDMGRKTDPYPNTAQVPPSGPGKLNVEEPRALVRSHTLASFPWDLIPLPPAGTGLQARRSFLVYWEHHLK